jgi:hypothetical protein
MSRVVVVHSGGAQSQAFLCEFEGSLSYRASPRATQRNPVSKKKKEEEEKKKKG